MEFSPPPPNASAEKGNGRIFIYSLLLALVSVGRKKKFACSFPRWAPFFFVSLLPPSLPFFRFWGSRRRREKRNSRSRIAFLSHTKDREKCAFTQIRKKKCATCPTSVAIFLQKNPHFERIFKKNMTGNLPCTMNIQQDLLTVHYAHLPFPPRYIAIFSNFEIKKTLEILFTSSVCDLTSYIHCTVCTSGLASARHLSLTSSPSRTEVDSEVDGEASSGSSPPPPPPPPGSEGRDRCRVTVGESEIIVIACINLAQLGGR